MVSQGTQKRSSRRKAKGQRSPLSTSGVLKLPQKMVHAERRPRSSSCGSTPASGLPGGEEPPLPGSRHQVGIGSWGELTQQSAARARRVIDKQVNVQDQCLQHWEPNLDGKSATAESENAPANSHRLYSCDKPQGPRGRTLNGTYTSVQSQQKGM